MSDSLFSIVGPVMVGPSSSHTAGAVRLGLLARMLANQPITHATFTLYNSFAHTHKGHGTDKGLLAGLLGFNVSDERIRTAFAHADEAHLPYEFLCDTAPNHYPPNTVHMALTLADTTTMTLIGHSIGAGRVRISQLNKHKVNLQGEMPTLLMIYTDKPGMIWQVTKTIAEAHINIATLHCNRQRRGKLAFMTITLDDALPTDAIDTINAITDVVMVRCLNKLPD